jgi:hypothetical protein
LADKAKYALPIFLLGVALYLGSLRAPFFYDDVAFVQHNPAVKSVRAAVATFGLASAGASDPVLCRHTFRPLLPLLYATASAVFGTGPFGYHVLVVLLHAVNGVLFFFVFLRFGLARPWACFAAALFVAHPVNVESPAWISGLDDISWVTFFLAALLVYLRWRERGGAWRFAAAVALYTISVLLKETAAAMPLAWLVLEFTQPAGERKHPRLASLIFFAPALGYMLWRTLAVGGLTQLDAFIAGSFKNTLLTTIVIFADYLRLLFFPVNLMLEYNPVIRRSPLDFWVIASALLLLGVFLHFGVRRVRTAAGFFFWLALFSLAPAANILPINALQNERFVYFASASFAFLLARALADATASRPRLRLVAPLLVAMFGALTIARVDVWREPLRLWADCVKKNPASVLAHRDLGVEYVQRGNLVGAEREFGEALAQDGGRTRSYQTLGYVHLLMGECDRAAREFQLFLADNPADPATLEQYQKALNCRTPGAPPP